MPLRRCLRSLARIAMAGLAFSFVTGCAKDPLRVDRNRAPRTFIVGAPGSSISGDTASASYRIHLYWRGEDPDGYITGFYWAFDDPGIDKLRYTTRTDSIFELTVNDSAAIAGGSSLIGTSRVHTFFVQAIDNLGKADPNLAIWNSRLFRAATIPPRAFFRPPLPSGGRTDTLSDGHPFVINWGGSDSDGVVTHFKYDVGVFSSGILDSSVKSASFNDSLTPGSVSLTSGLYTMTVTAVDNANAIGQTRFSFVVNNDPETWFEPRWSPIGHYIAPYIEGFKVDREGTFAQGDTVPYRSTVWFTWDGSDSIGGETNVLSGWNLNLRAGSRNGGETYSIGFLDTLPFVQPPVKFKTNNPAVLGPLGFTNLILDSLDQGFNHLIQVQSRDGSNRIDGLDSLELGVFRFACNRRPELRGTLTVADTVAQVRPDIGLEACKVIYWTSYDYEDGQAIAGRVQVDGGQIKGTVSAGDQFLIVANREFLQLFNPHSAVVRVVDRAGFESDPPHLAIQFNVP